MGVCGATGYQERERQTVMGVGPPEVKKRGKRSRGGKADGCATSKKINKKKWRGREMGGIFCEGKKSGKIVAEPGGAPWVVKKKCWDHDGGGSHPSLGGNRDKTNNY